MARLVDIERRLQNWARWRLGAGTGGLGYAGVKWGAEAGTGGAYREATIPTVDCEAEETDQAVSALPDTSLHRTLVVYYLQTTSERDALLKLCCGRSTLHARLARADRCIERWLSARHIARQDERARVEAIGAAARARLLQMRQNR